MVSRVDQIIKEAEEAESARFRQRREKEQEEKTTTSYLVQRYAEVRNALHRFSSLSPRDRSELEQEVERVKKQLLEKSGEKDPLRYKTGGPSKLSWLVHLLQGDSASEGPLKVFREDYNKEYKSRNAVQVQIESNESLIEMYRQGITDLTEEAKRKYSVYEHGENSMDLGGFVTYKRSRDQIRRAKRGIKEKEKEIKRLQDQNKKLKRKSN